ncbi:hypothetical protein [Streptomyces sp. NPDC060002]|uniref:hypothetical protein n=1 Tax=Streptomyces sp. NPDC060002 TaxID=3347033 RepID=UPI0036753AB9
MLRIDHGGLLPNVGSGRFGVHHRCGWSIGSEAEAWRGRDVSAGEETRARASMVEEPEKRRRPGRPLNPVDASLPEPVKQWVTLWRAVVLQPLLDADPPWTQSKMAHELTLRGQMHQTDVTAAADASGRSKATLGKFIAGEKMPTKDLVQHLLDLALEVLQPPPLAEDVQNLWLAYRAALRLAVPLRAELYDAVDARKVLEREKAVLSSLLSQALRHTQEETKRLKTELAEAQETAWLTRDAAAEETIEGIRQNTARQLAALEQHLQEVTGELGQERQRAETAESERGGLRATVSDQERRLAGARDLVREMNADLERQQEEIRILRQEIQVLRRQVSRLTEEETPPEVSTQASAEYSTSQPRLRDVGAQGIPNWQAPQRAAQETNRRTEDHLVVLPVQPPLAAHDPEPSPAFSEFWTFSNIAMGVGWFLSLFPPVFVYLDGAAFAAACFSEEGPPWWGLALLAVADLLFTAVGWAILMAIALFPIWLAEADEPAGNLEDSAAFPLGTAAGLSLLSLIVGFCLLLNSRVTTPGLWWLHTFGISG